MPLDDLRHDIILLSLLFEAVAAAVLLMLRSNCAGFELGCSKTCCSNWTHRSHCRSARVLVAAEEGGVDSGDALEKLLVLVLPLLLALLLALVATTCGDVSSLSCRDGADSW